MASLADSLRGALSGVVSDVGEVTATTRDVIKDNVVGLLKAGDNVATVSLGTVSDVASEGVRVISQTGASLTGGVAGLIIGAVEGAKEVGGDVGETTVEAARGTIKGTYEVGGDLGEAAVATVEGAIQAADRIGTDSGQLAKHAVLGTLRAADEIGSEAGGMVRKALLNAAALPHDVIDALLTGKTD